MADVLEVVIPDLGPRSVLKPRTSTKNELPDLSPRYLAQPGRSFTIPYLGLLLRSPGFWNLDP